MWKGNVSKAKLGDIYKFRERLDRAHNVQFTA